MTPTADTRQLIIDAITTVAPDADPTVLSGTEDYLDELDLDSMDQLNIAVCVFERTGVEIPERDYPKVRTLDAMVDYVTAASASAAG